MWSLSSLINRGRQRAIDWPKPPLSFSGNDECKGYVMENTEQLAPETAKMVDDMAVALKAKLLKSQIKYGYGISWQQTHWRTECQRQLWLHVNKGDPLDVAAYAAFCWFHGWSTSAKATPTGLDVMRPHVDEDLRFEAAFCLTHNVKQDGRVFDRDPLGRYVYTRMESARVLWDQAKHDLLTPRIESLDELNTQDIIGIAHAFLRRIFRRDMEDQWRGIEHLEIETAMRTALMLARRDWKIIGTGFNQSLPPIDLHVYAGFTDHSGEFHYAVYCIVNSESGWVWAKVDQYGDPYEDDDYSYLTHWRYMHKPPFDHLLTLNPLKTVTP